MNNDDGSSHVNPECCKHCGYTEIYLSHNTLTYYCIVCDEWIDETEDD